MKLIKKNISVKDGNGFVILCPIDEEDMWHCYNLISIGDSIRGTTIRKVVREGMTSIQSQRVRVNVTIQVIGIDFDPLECTIRVRGRNIEENKFIKLGAHHTIELEPNRNFTLTKQCWDVIFLERIETACNPAKSASLAAVVMEMGIAHVCLVKSSITLLRAKIEKSIPKKRANVKSHKEAVQKFFEQVLQAVVREIDFEIVKCVLISSPGYVKDDFFKYLLAEAQIRQELRPLLKNKDRFVLVHASCGYTNALDEVLADPNLQSRLVDVQAAREVQVLQKFFQMLNDSSDRAFYSYNHVQYAVGMGAVESLLVSDSLFRSKNIATRRRYVDLVEACRASGAAVYIFSSLHTSGQQLDQLSGVAAILRYALPDLEDMEFSMDNDVDLGAATNLNNDDNDPFQDDEAYEDIPNEEIYFNDTDADVVEMF